MRAKAGDAQTMMADTTIEVRNVQTCRTSELVKLLEMFIAKTPQRPRLQAGKLSSRKKSKKLVDAFAGLRGATWRPNVTDGGPRRQGEPRLPQVRCFRVSDCRPRVRPYVGARGAVALPFGNIGGTIHGKNHCDRHCEIDLCRRLRHGGGVQVRGHGSDGWLHCRSRVPDPARAGLARRGVRNRARGCLSNRRVLLRGGAARRALRRLPRLCLSWSLTLARKSDRVRIFRRPLHLHGRPSVRGHAWARRQVGDSNRVSVEVRALS